MYLKSVYKGVVHIRRVPHPPEISFLASIKASDLKFALATSLWPSLKVEFLYLYDMCLKERGNH